MVSGILRRKEKTVSSRGDLFRAAFRSHTLTFAAAIAAVRELILFESDFIAIAMNLFPIRPIVLVRILDDGFSLISLSVFSRTGAGQVAR